MVPKINKVAFEEALNMTGYSRYNLAIFLLCSAIIMGMTFELFSVSYLVPASVCELHTTSTQQGLLACVPLAGIICTSAVWGYLADTRGRKIIIIISMTMSFLSGILSAFSPHWIVLCVLKLLSSACVAGAFALSVTMLSECTPMAKRSALVILTTSILLICTACMAVIAIPILPLKFSYFIPILGIQFNSWRVLCLIYAFPSCLSALGAIFVFESPKYLLSVGKGKEALKVLRRMYVINTGQNGDTYKVDALYLEDEIESKAAASKGFFASFATQTGPLLRKPLLRHMAVLSALFVTTFICINSFIIWLPYIVNVLMSSLSQGNIYLTACEMIREYQNSTIVQANNDCSMDSFAMIMVFGIHTILATFNVITSVLIKYFGQKKMFILIQCIGTFAAFSVNYCPYWMLTSALFLIFLTGVFNFGYLSTYSVEIFPTYVRATAVCLTLMMGRGSAVIGINVLKQLLDHNCEYIFYMFGSLSFLGGIIGLLLPSDKEIGIHKTAIKP